MKIKLRFDNSKVFSGRYYFYKDLITLRIGRNLTFPCFSRYGNFKLNNFLEVLSFILLHEIVHRVQFRNKLPIDEMQADYIAYKIIKRGGNMARIYASGGGGAAGGGGARKSKSRKGSKSYKPRSRR